MVWSDKHENLLISVELNQYTLNKQTACIVIQIIDIPRSFEFLLQVDLTAPQAASSHCKMVKMITIKGTHMFRDDTQDSPWHRKNAQLELTQYVPREHSPQHHHHPHQPKRLTQAREHWFIMHCSLRFLFLGKTSTIVAHLRLGVLRCFSAQHSGKE